jgi:hypothetical protein
VLPLVHLDRQIHGGDRPLCMAQRLPPGVPAGRCSTDEVIIRNLPLHLADSARTWLEHLPPSQIHNWDDLVRTFIGNFQGTYCNTPCFCSVVICANDTPNYSSNYP